ncbi:UDP-N-acetylmuramoyl-tripeptide--D-alanyl-D-alanine ligase [Rickettsiales bacterium]|nr:UDP-N-acetylmuramoyl-tripeptide--D-alanyl-D-alanine ligase [Rickettsiales bacterium]
MNLFNSIELSQALNINIKKNISFDGISIDSRDIEKNSLFFPIKGEKFNGHDFILDAFQNGAKASIVEEKEIKRINKSFFNDKILIPVENSLQALQDLSRYIRNRPKDLKMICITGSNGKTSVKDWISSILSNFFITHSSLGNFNNHIGMPLSLARMKKNTEVCVLELGMNKPGEIQFLTQISKPDFSILTNVGPAHLGNFKNIEEIVVEKSSIFKTSKKSISIIPRDSHFFNLIDNIARKYSKTVLSFGSHINSDFKLIKSSRISDNISELEFELLGKIVKVKTQNHSTHHHMNILIILIIAELLEINQKEVIQQIYELKPTIGRGSIHEIFFNEKKIRLIDDSYNSNPMSLKVSLNNMNNSAYKNSRKICVIGDMLELGNNSEDLHRKMVDSFTENNINLVFTIGQHTKIIHDNLPDFIHSKHFDNIEILYNKLSSILLDDDIILVKGSNSMDLNKICKKLKKRNS